MLTVKFPQCMKAPNGQIVRFHDETHGEPYRTSTNSFGHMSSGFINALSGHWVPCADPTKPSKTKILLQHVRDL